mgnify:CR=1 FL=1
MATQEQLNRRARHYIGELAKARWVLWNRAREHDGVDPGSSLVVFSESNPYAAMYDRVAQAHIEAVSQYQAGGYVGLIIQHGKGSA